MTTLYKITQDIDGKTSDIFFATLYGATTYFNCIVGHATLYEQKTIGGMYVNNKIIRTR